MRSYKMPGTVTAIETMGDTKKHIHIKQNDGQFTVLFEDIGPYNKSLKIGDRVAVSYKYSNFMACMMVSRVTKLKKEV